MRFGRTLLLAAVCLALGAYIYFIEAPQIEKEAAPDRLLDVKAADVAEVHLTYPDGNKIRVVREGEGWRVKEPLDYAGDKTVMDRLVESVENVTVERRLPREETLEMSTYGLAGTGEQGRLELTKKDGTKLPAILVGGATPVGHQAFVRLENGEEVGLVPLLFHNGIKKTAFDVREKKLFDFDSEKVVAVHVSGEGKPEVAIERRDDQWYFRSPFQDRADKNAIRSLVESGKNLAAVAYFDGDAVKRDEFGLTKPTQLTTFDVGGGQTAGFWLGNKDDTAPPGFYVQRVADGQVAKVADWAVKRFTEDPKTLRDKALLHCDFDLMKRLRFRHASGEQFELVKGEGDAWTVEPTGDDVVRAVAANRVHRGLAELKGEEIVTDEASRPEALAQYGLDKPLVTVTVLDADSNACASVEAGSPDERAEDPTYYFRRTGSPTVLSGKSHVFSRVNFVRSDVAEAKKEEKPAEPAPGAEGSPVAPDAE